MVTTVERAALDQFCALVRAEFGPRVAALTLFGSRARGEGSEDSDVDVLVVIRQLSPEEAHHVAHLAGDLLTAHDVLISPLALSEQQFDHLRARERRIVREIERDGIAL